MADSIYEGAVNDLTDMSEFTEPTEDAEETGAEEAEDYEFEAETEEQEFTDPAAEEDAQGEADEESEEYEEDIPQGKRSRDHAFAEMRRAREEAEQRNSELQERLDALERAQREKDLRDYAEGMGLTEEEIEEVVKDAQEEEEKENARKELEEKVRQLEDQLLEREIDEKMQKDLSDIQKIDPSVKSLDDLGDDFGQFIEAGLDGVHAYYAMKAMQDRNKIKPARSIGRVNQSSVPRDFYTSEELDALSQEEILANWDKVQRSIDRL